MIIKMSTKAWPNSTTSFYNNCLSYKVFQENGAYSPTGFMLRAAGNNNMNNGWNGYIPMDIDFTLRSSATGGALTQRDLTLSQTIQVKAHYNISYSSPSPGPAPSPGFPPVTPEFNPQGGEGQ